MGDSYQHLEEARQTLCAHFPMPLPGETLYSVCARFHSLTAVRRPALTGLLLFGSHRASAKRCVPVGLTTLVSCLPHLFASELSALQQHTHACLYLRFMAPDQAACAAAVCAGPIHLRERHPFNWASAQFERQHPLRICPACVIADHDQIGYAYWHLGHQLPGVWVCPDHGEALHLPPSPDRKSILRAAARDRQSEEAAVRERQRRAMSAIGGQPTQTDVPANSSKSAEHVFHGMSKLLPRASWVSPATRRSNG